MTEAAAEKGCKPLNRAEVHHSRLLDTHQLPTELRISQGFGHIPLLPTQTTAGTQPAWSLPLIVTALATATIVHPVGISLGEGNFCQQAG